MAKYFTLLLLVSLRLSGNEPKRSTLPSDMQNIIRQVELVSFTGTIRDSRVLLQWIISKNEDVNRFEIERSTDNKTYSLTALVLCSEKAETDHYKFADKLIRRKIFYRIKIINKDGSVNYSSSLEIDPTAKSEPTEQTKTNSDAWYC